MALDPVQGRRDKKSRGSTSLSVYNKDLVDFRALVAVTLFVHGKVMNQ